MSQRGKAPVQSYAGTPRPASRDYNRENPVNGPRYDALEYDPPPLVIPAWIIAAVEAVAV